MHAVYRFVCGLAVAAVSASAATAQTYQSSTILNGANEVPPRATTATGFGTVTFNVLTNLLTVDETWTGLSSAATGAHIHCCATATANGPVAIDFIGVFGQFPTGLTAGSYQRTFDLLSSDTYGAGFLSAQGNVTTARNTIVAGLLAGQTYLNIHTAAFPGGEIRGQLSNFAVVPEPSTYALMAAGLCAVGLARRRKRARS